MASNRLEQAYSFHSKLSLSQMEARLNAGWPSFWIERDSHWKPDSISGALTSEASARIFEHGIEFYIVNVGFRPNPSGDEEEQANPPGTGFSMTPCRSLRRLT